MSYQVEVYIKGPALEPDFWAEQGGRWTYNGPYAKKRELVAAGVSLHLAPEGERPERVEQQAPSSVPVRLTHDSLIFTLPAGFDVDTLRGVWVVCSPPKDPRRRAGHEVTA